LVYKIVAKKNAEIMRSERISLLITVAKARVWVSEGWHVIVTDGDDKVLDAAEYDRFLAA
jgi:hypothetical protein